MAGNDKLYDKYHLWDFVKEQKEKGLIKHWGFSFHATPDILDEVLTAHPDAEFVQLQLNYADWENPQVTARENYEVARKHGKSIVVMEPVKGGALANPPKDVSRVFKETAPDASFASWAIRKAQELMTGIKSIPCTACHYCTDGCPQKISIPEVFAARNQQLVWGQLEEGHR